ncbi:MAG: glycosyltransferase [Planctomycetota bacterium]
MRHTSFHSAATGQPLTNALLITKLGAWMHEHDELALVAISLILPAYNEADAIEQAVEEAVIALSQTADDYEVIVVDDGSMDRTSAIVESIIQNNDCVRLVRHDVNRGYGAAIRSGFLAAKMNLVMFTDADCQFDLTEMDRFVLLSERYDVVCGYRLDRKDTALRCLYSKVYNVLTRALLGTRVRDVDCAFKMLRRDVAKSLTISGDGFLVNSELLVQARMQNRSIVEVGVSHRARTLGESTVSIRHIPKVFASLMRYWWNEVQFPSDRSASTDASDTGNEPRVPFFSAARLRQRTAWMHWLFFLVASVFILTNLGYPLIDRDETRYAEIAREMIATGDWILPQLNFQAYYDKPPLLYWLCAIAFQMFGISETSARLVPALAALGTLASTMYFGSRLFDRRTGLIAGVVLALSAGFAFHSRYLLLDGVLTLFVSLALLTAFCAVQPSNHNRSKRVAIGWWMISAACVGLAFLTKGPVAVVLWLPPVLAFTWLSKGPIQPGWRHYAVAGCVVSLIATPWFAMVHQRDSHFLMEFFYTHNASRFGGQFHNRPFWYFVPVLLIAGHPWSFLAIPYGRFLFSRRDRLERPPILGFLLLWSLWTFVFF